MGIPYDTHITIELDIGHHALELCVDLACELIPGTPTTHDDPGTSDEVEIIRVGDMWEEFIMPGETKKTRKVYGPPSEWMQELIKKHADREELLERAPDPRERDDL